MSGLPIEALDFSVVRELRKREGLTLEELSEEFGVSRERVRQIEVRAFEKVQKAVREAVAKQEAGRLALPAHA